MESDFSKFRNQLLGNSHLSPLRPLQSFYNLHFTIYNFSNFENQPLWNSHSLLSPPYSETCPELVQSCCQKYKVKQRTTMCNDQ